MSATNGNAKLQRWVDLLAALLVRNGPASFDELARDVPEYGLKLEAARNAPDARKRKTAMESVKRTFERDKDELRAFGVPIESVEDEDGNEGGAYRLRRDAFYLPYLMTIGPTSTREPNGPTSTRAGGPVASAPKRVDRYGYRALRTLTFEPDELQAVVDAAACVQSLGDPMLAAEAASALRKMAVDLPMDVGRSSADVPHVVLPRTRPDAAAFEALSDALARRKVATFDYHAMSSGRTERREVEPYGLFFLSGHWYLAARDRARGEGADAIRNFRLDRMSAATVNDKRPQTADYEIAPTFHLRDHARSRQAWELGDGDAMHAVVELRGTSGPTMAARKLGAAVEGHDDRRALEVRRLEPFVRWMLSFGGEVVPVSPEPLVAAFRTELGRIAALYDGDGGPGAGARGEPPQGVATSVTPAAARAPAWEPTTAAAQLRRILQVVPQIADGEEHAIATVAKRAGTDAATLRRDLYSLVTRFDVPAGFVGGVELYLERDRVSSSSNALLRPMRLTRWELKALELGLAVLRAQRGPASAPVLEKARERLQAVIAKLPDEPLPGMDHAAWLGEVGDRAAWDAVRRAVAERRELWLTYRRSGSSEARERVVRPYGLVAARGMVYLVGWCEGDGLAVGSELAGSGSAPSGAATVGEGIRVFRMDRVERASVLDRGFERPADFSVDEVVDGGRVFVAGAGGEAVERLVVWYSPRVARWIAEREGLALGADGSVVVEYPLADREWGVRQVMQYGGEAVVVGPETVRNAIVQRARSLGPAESDSRRQTSRSLSSR